MSINITLERDGHDQPWGFRLQGGVDVGLPLSVLRVLVGTPAESVFKKGDLVTTISQTETRGLTHQQAVDLFNHAGNQINVVVKRPGVGGVAPTSNQPTISTLQLSAANKQQQQQQQTLAGLAQQTGEKTEYQSPQVAALPRTTFVLKSSLPAKVQEPTANSDDYSIQNQPYRTLPLVQPCAKTAGGFGDIGAGSIYHLKLQEEHCTGVREPQLVPIPQSQLNAAKANDLIMKQKVRSRSPDPSASIRSLLRPTPCRPRPAWKDYMAIYKCGRGTFKVGGQQIQLKPCKQRSIRSAFQPKPLVSPNMWRNMLKETPIIIKKVKVEVKEKREPLPEVVLRKERVIRIATRDRLEEYFDDKIKDGLPGAKKFKPRNIKIIEHEEIVGPAIMTEVIVKFIVPKRQITFTVTIKRFEALEQSVTVGDKGILPPGPCASFTICIGNGSGVIEEEPEGLPDTVDVEKTISVMAYDPMTSEVDDY